MADEPAHAALPGDPLAERGRGLPIMRRCVDDLTISSTPGRGTVNSGFGCSERSGRGRG